MTNTTKVCGPACLSAFKIRIAWWIAREPRKSQQEGLEDQGTLKQLGGDPLSLVPLPGPPGLVSGLLKAFTQGANVGGSSGEGESLP